MTIENLTHIINGQILNNPSISSVTSFAFEAKNIKRGYALIATQSDQIAPAIKQGAYAIISEEEIINFLVDKFNVRPISATRKLNLKYFLGE